jgi:type VI secretion system secreted protein Hcp
MAVDYFLKIDGIDGESADDKHKNDIDVQSFSWGASNAGTMAYGGGGGAGKVSFNDFHFTMGVNKATPKLIQACASGEHIKKAVFIARKAGKKQEEFLTIKFTDILISSYQTGGGHGAEIPNESISFNFSKVEYEYKEQKADGSLGGAITAGWDLKKNVKV